MSAGVSREELESTAKVVLHESVRRATTFMQQFIGQPDHVAVIIATSKMDELLGASIRERLLPCVEKKDDFLDSERGLGTFSNRIVMAYRIGIIDDSLARALHIFRRIRNDFAHTYEGQSLDNAPHRDRISALGHTLSSHPKIVELRTGVATSATDLSEHKLTFVVAATSAIARLELAKSLVRMVDKTCAQHAKFP